MQKNQFNQIIGEEVKNWHGAKTPVKNILQGQFVILEPFDLKKHGRQLFDSFNFDNKGESWTYLPYGPFDHYADFESWLKNLLLEKDTLLYALIDANTLKPIGMGGYLRINSEHGVIEVGHLHYSIHLKKKPGATEAMYLLMKQAFDNWGYRRYEWKCHSLNEASRNAALRLGFTFEGIFRQSNVFKNHNRDTAWFSILDKEWPELKKRFENWLQPENFDEHGKQKKSL
jgi:RimJ/RimL family protein N-acetyltransferase